MTGFGLTTHALVSDPKRPMHEQVDEAAEVIRLAAKLGTYDSVRAQHHQLSYPTVWLEPFSLLARWAPDAGEMKLMTSVMKPPIHNPVDLAHQVATIDQMCNGRFVFGVGIGYQEDELETVGATRKQRVSRFEESIALMKALWTGEEVTFEGRYTSVHNIRMGYTPVQRPHPPIWNAAYSIPAARRAARICDGLYIANQATWAAARTLADEYNQTLAACGKTQKMVGANRNMAIASTFEEANRFAKAEVERSAAYYGSRGMNEASTLEMILDPEADHRRWAIVGTPQDCLEQISQQIEEIGFDWIGLSFMNLPKDHSARLEYVQYVSDELLSKLVKP